MNLQILPLAITMMMGPQIMSALILVTSDRAVRVSLAFLVGVLVATTAGVTIARIVLAQLGNSIPLGSSADRGSAGNLIQFGLIALLLIAAMRNYVRRDTVKPPKWLTSLLEAGPGKALLTGLLVILLMPSDIIIMLTVGANLAQDGARLSAALPFIAATVLIAALPLLFRLVFHHRALRVMPRVRSWMNANSWVINVATCLIFVLLLL